MVWQRRFDNRDSSHEFASQNRPARSLCVDSQVFGENFGIQIRVMQANESDVHVFLGINLLKHLLERLDLKFGQSNKIRVSVVVHLNGDFSCRMLEMRGGSQMFLKVMFKRGACSLVLFPGEVVSVVAGEAVNAGFPVLLLLESQSLDTFTHGVFELKS